MSTPHYRQVGNKFVVEYYTRLNSNPSELSNYHATDSYFTHGFEGTFGQNDEVCQGREAIQTKIDALGLKDCYVTLSVVDCQPSRDGAVFVLVVGQLGPPNSVGKKFVQSFLLVEEKKGAYFIANDVFRFIDDQKEEGVTAPAPEKVEEAPKEQQAPAKIETPAPVVEKKPEPVKEVQQPEKKVPVEKPQEEKPQEAPVKPAPQKKSTPKVSQPPKEPPKEQTPPPKEEKKDTPKTWAGILGGNNNPVMPVEESKPQQQQAKPNRSGKPKKVEASDSLASSPSLYISNAPFTVTEQQIRAIFSVYGEIKHIKIVENKGYLFLDFATTEEAQRAIDGAKNEQLKLENRSLSVVESKRDQKKKTPGSGQFREQKPKSDKPKTDKPENNNQRKERTTPTTERNTSNGKTSRDQNQLPKKQ